jgi:class 3 adenylate cyclase
VRWLPWLVGVLVLAALFLVEWIGRSPGRMSLVNRLEWATYDWRVRLAYAATNNSRVATNLGFVAITDDCVTNLNRRFGVQPPFPRFLHGEVLRELHAQGAGGVAFDVLFEEAGHDCEVIRKQVTLDQTVSTVSSDEAFAMALRDTKLGILSAPASHASNEPRLIQTLPLLRAGTLVIGHAKGSTDADGAHRRVPLFVDDPKEGRVWTLGVVLGARALGLDLAGAEVHPGRSVTFSSTNGTRRTLQLFPDNTTLIDWQFQAGEDALWETRFSDVVGDWRTRAAGTNPPPDFAGRFVIVGSITAGNNLTDRGQTPLHPRGYLPYVHMNLANALITGVIPRRAGLAASFALIGAMALLAGLATWRLRLLLATSAVVVAAGLYLVVSAWAWTEHRYWMPVVLPIGGALLMTHLVLVAYRAVFERAEIRRVRSHLRRLIAPNVLELVMESPPAALQGTHRPLTIMFADLRGFTEFIDHRHGSVVELARERRLAVAATDELIDQSARQTLAAVNSYLGAAADEIKHHDGTLDKYIGDCVMAFWGAPLEDTHHARHAVHAAQAVQRAVARLNQSATAAGDSTLQMQVGIGINSGRATVGFMGSDQHISNYTAFGRDVNLASRLESMAPGGEIWISEATWQELRKDAPELAGQCVDLGPRHVRGFTEAARIFQVPW